MNAKQALLTEPRVLMKDLAMGESPRWHEDRLWFSDWGAQEIISIGLDGKSEVMVRTPFELPFCIDWLPDGRLLIVSDAIASFSAGSKTGPLRPMLIFEGSRTRAGTRLSWMVAATLI